VGTANRSLNRKLEEIRQPVLKASVHRILASV
jgi:hypothetical protein